jgi:hypothetical protein
MADTQLVALVTEYAQNPAQTLEEVALKLQISLANARRIMKKFAYAVAATQQTDPDFPALAAEKLGLTVPIILAMERHVDNYADKQILNELKRVGIGPGARGITADSTNPYSNGYSTQPTAEISAAALTGSSPTKILAWILTYIFKRDIEPGKADAFLQIFRMDEDSFMQNPIRLENKMLDVFGQKVGKAIFSQFYDMVATRLGPSQQFGSAAWGPTPGMFGGGNWAQGPQTTIGPYTRNIGDWRPGNGLSIYQAKGVIPVNTDPNSPEAQRIIDQYEYQERLKRNDDEIQMKLKNLLNMRMVDLFDGKNPNAAAGGGALGMAQNLAPYIASGNVRMIVRQGANGQPETVYENTGMSGGHGLGGGILGGDGQSVGLLDVITRSFTAANDANNRFNAMMQPIFTQMLQKGAGLDGSSGAGAFVEQMKAFKEMSESFGGYRANFNDSLEAAKLLIAEKRINADHDVALQTLANKRIDEQATRQWEHEQEKFGAKRMDSFLQNVVGAGLNQFGPIIQELVAAKLRPKADGDGSGFIPQGGGAGYYPTAGPEGNGGGNNGGNGARRRKMPGKMVTPQDIYRATAGAEYGQRTEGEIAQQYAIQKEREARERLARQETEQMNNWAKLSQARTYNPTDFTAYTPDQIQAFKAQGQAWLQSAQNYNDALSQAEYEKMLQSKRSGQPVAPTTFAQPQGPVATGPKRVEVSAEAATAAELAATVSPVTPTGPGRIPEPTVNLQDVSEEEYQDAPDDDELANKEYEGDYEDSGVTAEEPGDIA